MTVLNSNGSQLFSILSDCSKLSVNNQKFGTTERRTPHVAITTMYDVFAYTPYTC